MKEKTVPLKEGEEVIGNYLISSKPLGFIPSGCLMLDLVLSGGYPLGRIVNIVGDKSTGKTLLAIEACANFALTYEGTIHYIETEAAFDNDYAQMLGMPMDRIVFPEDIRTVEAFFEYVSEAIKSHTESEEPGLIILDSLDALSDKAEMEADFEKGTYGMGKPKGLSKMFRMLAKNLEKTKLALIIISQVRYNIGVTFGEKYTRSGGKALDMYASLILWLAEIEKIKRTIKGMERIYGLWVRANCKKNKVGLPYRKCDIPLIFAYGMDDAWASLDWMSSVKGALEKNFGISKKGDILDVVDKSKTEKVLQDKIKEVTANLWNEIETDFMPKTKKYA